MTRSIVAAFVGLAILSGTACAQSVVTYHNSPDRAGNFTVPGLTLAAAANLHTDATFHAALSGNVYAQPLYWKPAGAAVGLLIVATESSSVYALNADSGAQVWKAQFAASAPRSALPCGNIDPEGITGTPVIDPATGRLYLDALTSANGTTVKHKIYALSLATGKVVPGWPVDVESLMAARSAAFASDVQGERSALQFVDGKLYVNYSGRYGDCGAYHGIVIEVDPTKRTITGDWQTRATGGGIWAQGGIASDGTSLFATTGNTFGADSWGDGEAIIRLKPGLAHSTNSKDYFTPSVWKNLDNEDRDLGGTEAMPLTVPRPGASSLNRLLALGKDGKAYLVAGSNLGGVGGALTNLQVSNTVILTEPTVYNTASGTLVGFVNYNGSQADCSGNNLTMLKVSATKPLLSVAWCSAVNGAGSPITTTTNGTANPIVWVVGAEGDNQLHGFNALTGKTVFDGGGITMNSVRHFSTLIAANGHLYVAGDNGVYAFTF